MKNIYRFLFFFSMLSLLGVSCQRSIEDGGVFKSWDTAENWEQKVYFGQDKKNRPVLIDGADIKKLFIEPENEEIIYALAADALYKTYNGGEQWKQLPIDAAGINFIAIDPEYTNNIYIARNGDIIKSTEGGEGSAEVIYRDTQGGIVSRIAVDWYNQQRLYAITTKGAVLQSEDEGGSWRTVHQTDNPLTELKMSSDDSRVLYLMEPGIAIWKTEDAGKTWENLFETTEERKEREEDEARDEELIFEEVEDEKSSIQQDDEENDDKKEIKTAKPRIDFKESFPDADEVLQLAIDPNDGDTIYISSPVGIIKTEDGGFSWERVQTVISEESEAQNAAIKNITIQPDDSDVILFTVGRLIHKTEDGGKTWRVIESFPSERFITAVLHNPEVPEIVYIGVAPPPEEKDESLFIGY